MLSLNRSDRIRLINFDRRVAALVKSVILRFFQTKEGDLTCVSNGLDGSENVQARFSKRSRSGPVHGAYCIVIRIGSIIMTGRPLVCHQ